MMSLQPQITGSGNSPAEERLNLPAFYMRLGEEAKGLSDDEVDEIRRHAQAMAHLVVEIAHDELVDPLAHAFVFLDIDTDHRVAPLAQLVGELTTGAAEIEVFPAISSV